MRVYTYQGFEQNFGDSLSKTLSGKDCIQSGLMTKLKEDSLWNCEQGKQSCLHHPA